VERREKKSDQDPHHRAGQRRQRLWRRSKSELTDEDYKELYKSITGDWEDPLFWFHTKAEGSLEYTTLFYIPAKAPLDLYQADYKGGVKLYVKRVFIMDDAKELAAAVPALRPRHHRQRRSSAQRQPRDPAAESRAHQHPHRQRQEDPLRAEEHRGQSAGEVSEVHRRVQPPAQRRSVRRLRQPRDAARSGPLQIHQGRGLTSLADVKSRMKKGRRASTTSPAAPNLCCAPRRCSRSTRRRIIEVLILDDDIDEIVFSGIDKYGDIDLKAVNKASTSEDLKDEAEPGEGRSAEAAAREAEGHAGDRVKDVRASVRLADSPSVHRLR
jgi:molecular chaperone HtpG